MIQCLKTTGFCATVDKSPKRTILAPLALDEEEEVVDGITG